MKPVLLSYGNCQALAMQVITLDLPSVVDRYDVRYLPCHHSLGSTEVEPGLIERCEVVWDQVGIAQHLPFRESLRPGTRSVRFPELSFPLLWPLSCVDPRNVPDPPRHWGRYPCGDRLALQLMKEGLYGAQGYAAWVERGRASIPDLHRLLDLELARGRRRAADVDLEPTTYILENWHKERLFSTFNHPSNTILWSLCVQLLEMSLPSLQIPQAELVAARERFMNPAPGAVDMDWFQMVIHPHVAETFDLTWCDDDALHRLEVPGVERRLTRREYMADHYMVPSEGMSERDCPAGKSVDAFDTTSTMFRSSKTVLQPIASRGVPMIEPFVPYVAKDRRVGPYRLDLHIEDAVGREWYDSPTIENMREWSWYLETIKPGFHILDCGAHQGFVSVLFALCAGPSGVVHAWDPMPSNAALIERNAALNGLSNIVVHARGVGSTNARMPIVRNLGNVIVRSGDHLPEGNDFVEIVRIDDELHPDWRVDFMKLDVEGFELEALAGATRVLRQRPYIMVELHNFLYADPLATVASIVERIASRRYEFQIDDFTDTITAVGPVDVKALSALRHAQLWCRPL